MEVPEPAVRVRIAPSPTGFAHLGTASTALYNVIFARQHDGTFALRVDDTDVERNRPEYELLIYESLHWLGLDWDEGPDRGGPYGPYRQSERLDLYKEQAAKLLTDGKAYRCYCTPEELEAERRQAQAEKRPYKYSRRCLIDPPKDRTEFAVRFKVPGGKVHFTDMIRGGMTFDADLIYIGAAGTKLPDGTPDPATVTRGDCVSVEGFSLSHAGGNAVEADRVQNFAVSRNVQQGGAAKGLAGGVVTRGANGVIEGNFLTQDTGGVFALGGNATFPANVQVVANRLNHNGNGIIAKGSPWGIQPVVARANPLAGVPFADVFETLSIEISGNDLSENAGSLFPGASQGIKIGVVFDHSYPPSPNLPCTDPRVVIRGEVDAFVHDNRINQNDIGVVIDGDYPYRTFNHVADCRLFEGRIDVTFKDNDVTGNLRAPLALTFTRNIAATDRRRLDPKLFATSFQYVQNSFFSVSDPDGSLVGGWLDHPVTDPIDGRTLNNRLFLNADEMPPPFRTYPNP